MKLTLVHLYPREMNIYGDTGNVLVLRRRLQWRGLDVAVVPVAVGDAIPVNVDIILGGGGQDAESLTKMKPLSVAEKNAKKAQRKREKDARRKTRR